MSLFQPLQIEKINTQLQRLNAGLLSAAIKDDTGLYWPSPYYEGAGQYSFKTTMDIFNGSSGIALYFMALFEYSGRQEDLKIAEDMVNRTLKSAEVLEARSFGFYTGITGVIYACVRLYELSRKKKYLEAAASLAKTNQENMINRTVKADFLSGYSGSLFVITLLYHHVQSETILAMIQQMVDRLTREARISESGLKWDYDRSKSSYDSLAGFSHGASGIAYAMMQVGNYFKHEGLIYLAEQALQYEMQYFNQESENWLDLRLGSYRLGLPDAYKWDLNLFLPEMKDVNSWAHGAAGIGLARLYAWQITGNQTYLEQCKTVLNRCIADLKKMDRTDFSLCSGYSGMLPFLLKFHQLSSEDLSPELYNLMEQANYQYEQKGSYNTYISANSFDYGLLSGKAGIGYMLLQLLNPDMNSVVYPVLPSNKAKLNVNIGLSKRAIQHGIFFQHYPGTIQLLNTPAPGFIEALPAENLPEFEEALDQKINDLSALEGWKIKEVFNFEREITRCWKAHKGYLCYAKKNEFLNTQNQHLPLIPDEELMCFELKLSDHVTFYPISSTWRPIMELKATDQAALFILEETGLNVIYIGQLPAIIISQMGKTDIDGNKLIDLILNKFLEKAPSDPDYELFKQRVTLQIRSLIRNGIISINYN